VKKKEEASTRRAFYASHLFLMLSVIKVTRLAASCMEGVSLEDSTPPPPPLLARCVA
jgi:hypothetical protein